MLTSECLVRPILVYPSPRVIRPFMCVSEKPEWRLRRRALRYKETQFVVMEGFNVVNAGCGFSLYWCFADWASYYP